MNLNKTEKNQKDLSLEIWIDSLSVISFLSILNIASKKKIAIVHYVDTYCVSYWLIKGIKKISMFPVKFEKIQYSLGDMWDKEEFLGIKFIFFLPETAQQIVQQLKKRKIYKELIEYLPEEKIDIYFESIVREKIYNIIRLFLIAEWELKKNVNDKRHILLCKDFPLMEELLSTLQNRKVSIKSYKYPVDTIKKYLKGIVKIIHCFNPFSISKKDLNKEPCLSIQYSHGLDDNKRSDMFWYSPGTGVEPGNILICFDESGQPFVGNSKRKIYDQIERLKMRWIHLPKYTSVILKRHMSIENQKQIKYLKNFSESSQERFIYELTKNLIYEIAFWQIFLKTWNIKVVFDGSNIFDKYLPQNIALDLVGGIRIGIQRSAINMTEYQPFLRYNSSHLYFVWGKEAESHKGTSKSIEHLVLSGFPFDKAFDNNSSKSAIQEKLKKNGVKFVIALFDNNSSNYLYFSEKMMTLFYSKFLEWLIEDNEIAIVTKEKKPLLLDKLSEAESLISRAEKTGRFSRLGDVYHRFPSDAAHGADMAVGIGISSAVLEAVITGCRGIHCDLPKHKFHSYYDWGYEKVIFDDIDKLIAVLKKFKENPDSNPELGDWTPYLDRLDPFRDGRAGERIGSYMRWCLEGFDEGLDRDAVLDRANKMYAAKWGKDKVVDMREAEKMV